MTRAHAASTVSAPAAGASTTSHQKPEQREENRKPPGILAPATRFLCSAQSQYHAGHCQAEVIPQQVRGPRQIRAGTRRRGPDVQHHIRVAFSGSHLAGSECARAERRHSGSRARQTHVTGENAAVSQGHDVEVVTGALSRRDGLAGRIVVDGEIEADDQFHRGGLVDVSGVGSGGVNGEVEMVLRIVACRHRKCRACWSRSERRRREPTGQRHGPQTAQVYRTVIAARSGQGTVEHARCRSDLQ